MNRDQKKQLVSELTDVLGNAHLVIVTRQSGLTVSETEELRRTARKSSVSFKVAKNKLANLALSEGKFKDLTEFMKGPTALAYGDDPVTTAKVVSEFADKNEKLAIVGAMMDGKKLLAKDIKMLATLPSLDQLRAKIIGLVNAPATRIAGVLQAPAGQVARVFSAYGSKA